MVNPKGGAGKTVATLDARSLTLGQARNGYVLAWDNNETQGTLGMRAQLGDHKRNVRDLLRDLGPLPRASSRRDRRTLPPTYAPRTTAMFDVLASDESATAGEMLTAQRLPSTARRGDPVLQTDRCGHREQRRADNWSAAVDATDQLVITVPGRNDSAETAARMLDHLDQHRPGRARAPRGVVVTEPPQQVGVNSVGVDLRFIETPLQSPLPRGAPGALRPPSRQRRPDRLQRDRRRAAGVRGCGSPPPWWPDSNYRRRLSRGR